MKMPTELKRAELLEIVSRVQRILWHDGDQWDGDRPWDSAADVLEGVASVLGEHDLRPEALAHCEGCGDPAELADCEYCAECCRSICDHEGDCLSHPPTCTHGSDDQ